MEAWLFVQIGTKKGGTLDLINVTIPTLKKAKEIFKGIGKMVKDGGGY